jgi:serine/threonine protein phosphatase 1
VPSVMRLGQNYAGRDFVVGDIHAHARRMMMALWEIGFDPVYDRLICVGDLVDRGSETEEILELLREPWFFSVMGNHDDFAVRVPSGKIDVERYIKGGGEWNMRQSPEQQQRFADAFRDLPFVIEVETAKGVVGIVHADCARPTWAEFVKDIREQTQGTQVQKTARHDAMWSRDRYKRGLQDVIPDIRAVIVGHCTVPYVKTLGNVHYIDTGGWTSRRTFTFMRVDTLVSITVRTEE